MSDIAGNPPTTATAAPAAPTPQTRMEQFRDAAPWIAAAATAGLLLYFAGISARDVLFHPLWSLRRMVQGLADELPAVLLSLLQGALLVAPVWLMARLLGRRV